MSEGTGQRRYTPRIPAQERRDQILDAVLEVIADQGTAAVTVDGIARKLGFTRPVIYTLFTDADHLLRESLKREERRAIDQISDLVPLAASGAPEAVAHAFRRYLQAVLEEPLRWRSILLPIGAPPALIKTLGRGRDEIIGLAVEAMSTARTEAPQLDLELSARMMLAFAEEAGRLVLAQPEIYSPERLTSFAESTALAFRSAPDRPAAGGRARRPSGTEPDSPTSTIHPA